MGSPDENSQSGYNDNNMEERPSTNSTSPKDISKTETNEVPNDRESGTAASSWRPGALRQFPVYGIVPLLLSIACTGIAILIVKLTHHKDINEWSGPKTPQVLLSYTSTVANSLMGVAFAEAAVITFWRGAVGGMPVSNLHYVWSSSSSVVGALNSLWRRRAVGVSLASIFVAISTLLRGPLMQRAVFVELVDLDVYDTIKMPVMANMSDEWAGMASGRALQDIRFSPGFAHAVTQYQYMSPMSILGANCTNCELNVVAFGFQVDCTATEIPYNLTADSVEQILNRTLGATVFDSRVTVVEESPRGSLLNISILRKVDFGLEGNLLHNVCLLSPSLLNYSMVLDGTELSFKSETWFDDTSVEDPIHLPPVDAFVAPINMTLPYISGFGTTLPALRNLGSLLFASTSNISYDGVQGWLTSNSGLLANLYYSTDSSASASTLRSSDPNDYSFDDPMHDIINSFRDIAFRMSLQAAAEANDGLNNADVKVFQEIEYVSHQSMARYATDTAALALAIVISLLGPVATLMLFWGWWKLGRRFTMSPLEMINAVLAPGPELFDDDGDDEREQGQMTGQKEVARVLAECNARGETSGADLANQVRQNGKDGEQEPVLRYAVDGRGKMGLKVVGGSGRGMSAQGVRRRRERGGFWSGLVDVLVSDG